MRDEYRDFRANRPADRQIRLWHHPDGDRLDGRGVDGLSAGHRAAA